MLDRYLGIVLVSVVLYYLFKNASDTRAIVNSLSGFNTNAISALQGRAVTATLG